MLLRIIDIPAQDDQPNRIKIVFENEEVQESFTTESYSSPFYESFYQKLAWYFSEYLQQPYTIDSNNGKSVCDQGVSEKLIKYGQYMGDELLGEDFQLIKIIEAIDEKGYHNLSVQLESTRTQFFKEPWENIILYESKYVLSAVTRQFVRQFIPPESVVDLPEIDYQLKAPQSQQDDLNKLLGSSVKQAEIAQQGVKQGQVDFDSLRILYLVSRSDLHGLSISPSQGIKQSIEADAAIDFEVHQRMGLVSLNTRLQSKKNPVHIVHYNGPVILENQSASLVLADETGANQQVKIEEFAQLFTENNIGLLSLDAIFYQESEKIIPASEGLAKIAVLAQQQGIGNIIGLSQITDCWTSQQCFSAVYAQIRRGHDLTRAVVEARKSLQVKTETTLMNPTSAPFLTWPLLIHYSIQPVAFYDAHSDLSEPGLTSLNNASLTKLHGFKTEFLPPMLRIINDGYAASGLDYLQSSKASGRPQALSIIGEQGLGKSHTVHLINLYLAQKDLVDFGFYFDFEKAAYTAQDILQMIAPLIELSVEQTLEVENALSKHHCCFVLDNILQKERLPAVATPSKNELSNETENSALRLTELENFLQRMLTQGHKVILTGESDSLFSERFFDRIEVSPLSSIEQKVLASQCIQSENVTQNLLIQEKLAQVSNEQSWQKFLDATGGNPWLIQKSVLLLLNENVTDPLKQAKANLRDDKHNTDSRETSSRLSEREIYYKWQWGNLSPLSQRLLTMCARNTGLLLEMLMTAFDQGQEFLPVMSLVSKLSIEKKNKESAGLNDEWTLSRGNDEANNSVQYPKFRDLIQEWYAAGFVTRFPHGHIVAQECLSFLNQKRNEGIFKQVAEGYQLNFSQLVCEGLRIISSHVIQQPNPNISNNLLINRRVWVDHFELLWINKDFKGFIRVKNSFEPLMRQAKLNDEFNQWIVNLLGRSNLPDVTDKTSNEEKLAWLALATSVLESPIAKDNQVFSQGASIWQSWFDSFADTSQTPQLPLLQQAATFLEKFYQIESNWISCVSVVKQMLDVYVQYEAWQLVSQSLKSLSRYHYELKKPELAHEYEERVFSDIPYADAPPGFKTKQQIDILLTRIAYSQEKDTQFLLDQIRRSEESEKYSVMLNGIQSEIHILTGDYSRAIPHFREIWVKAVQENNPVQIEQLKMRLLELEQKMGKSEFDKSFENGLPTGTLMPREYSSKTST